jgi:hypothetical protein
MLSLLEYMRLHVEAEFTHDMHGQLTRVNDPTGAAAPRFFLGQTAEGVVRRFRHDVPEVVRRKLEAASTPHRIGRSELETPLDPTPYAAILSENVPVEHASVGLAFRFPFDQPAVPGPQLLHGEQGTELLRPLLPQWIPDLQSAQPLIALVIDDRAVAVCGSVRITARAHEAGVETAAALRGRGYAAAVIATWSEAVRERGAEPIYSTLWHNAASRRVASKLRLVPIGRDLHIT